MTERCVTFRSITAVLARALLASCLLAAGVPDAVAAGTVTETAFRDPYTGGIRLPNDGGEPGHAYMAFISAAYRRDHKQLCELMAGPADVALCLRQRQALDASIALFTAPKAHRVLGGFMKGDEATLDVSYTHDGAPASRGFVVMRKAGNRWTVSSFGGSGSSTVSAEAGATAVMSGGAGPTSAAAAQSSAGVYSGPAKGTWTFEGKDDKGGIWKGTLTISEQDAGGGSTYIDCSLDMTSVTGMSSGVGSECAWDPAARVVMFGPESMARYRAVLAADGRSMERGTWTESERDGSTGKARIKTTGAWTAVYQGGPAATAPASPSPSADAVENPEFAVIRITPNVKEYTGRCPATIAFTADITFTMPLPEKFSYRWEFSNGTRTPDRVLKPAPSGRLSVREVWKGGKQGDTLTASARFVAEAGERAMILDPPGVTVVCK